jgi:aromatic ring-opening dioxygenase LigB subunit
MAESFLAIVPHSPILMPSIGKDKQGELEQTIAAYNQITRELHEFAPDAVFIVSPHATDEPQSEGNSYFLDVVSPSNLNGYSANLEQFGDFSTTLDFHHHPELIEHIQTWSPEFNVQPVARETLDYGVLVPAYYLLQANKSLPLVSVSLHGVNRENFMTFGTQIKEMTQHLGLRIAVILSAELSHCVNSQAPAGFHQSGPLFDQYVQELLMQRNFVGIAEMNKQTVSEALTCGYAPLLVAAGFLSGEVASFSPYAYEAPFGVGYLTGKFVIE